MKTKYPTFKKGQTVTWTSQASGFKKKKQGEVIAVIRAGAIPSERLFPWSSWKRLGQERNHTSYVVRTKDGSTYWPLAKNLKRK